MKPQPGTVVTKGSQVTLEVAQTQPTTSPPASSSPPPSNSPSPNPSDTSSGPGL
jgi:hypothetical protein